MGYGVASRVFHWLTVLLVCVMIPAGWSMTQEIPRATQDRLFILHKNGGVIVFGLVALRLGWRAFNPPPPLPPSTPPLQRRAAAVVHAGLYALLLTMTISGYLRVVAGGFPVEMLDVLGAPRPVAMNEALANAAKAVHATAVKGLVALIAVHVGAAAYHGLVRRDGVVSRMWPPFPASRRR